MSDRATRVVTDQSAVTMTSTTTGSGILVERYATVTGIVDVTAASGTNPTLDIAIQVSADNSVYVTHSSFTQITAVTTALKTASILGQYVRLKYTIGGTGPSFTLTAKLVFQN